MKNAKKIFSLSVLVIALFAFSAAVGFAHPKGDEKRTVAECDTLDKGKKRCKHCVTKPKKHHFHPKVKTCHKNLKK
ncbi:MAG: hypothetical protein GY754_31620 [bacterium]|nr:hypothetical protein [bacterium]